MEDTKPELNEADLNYRSRITKVRGGWTQDKIKKELKNKKGIRSDIGFQREICKYDTPKDFEDNLFYHGSARSISNLKPSISLKYSEHFGGGYGEQYYSISLSKCRNIATNFTGISSSGSVAPVILKRNAVVKEMPEISDSNELSDLIVDLWEEGVDAVLIGDHSSPTGEQELAILNPECIIVGKPEYFQVFEKKKMPSFSSEKIEDMWLNAANNYKDVLVESWERSNVSFKQKYGKDKTSEKFSGKSESIANYNKHNVEEYKKNKEVINDTPVIESFLKKAEKKVTKKIESSKLKR